MDKASLRRLLPQDKEDAQRAAALVALGYPAVEPVLPQMLEWLKTLGSPVDLAMREFFVSLGVHAVPVVRDALRSRNDLLKYAVVTHVVAFWPGEAVKALASELQGLATGCGCYGTDITALKLLIEHRLAEQGWLAEWTRFKVDRLRELLGSAEELVARLEDSR